MSSASFRTLLKFCQRWELNILWSGASPGVPNAPSLCFGVPCLSSVLPCHLIQLTTCGDQLTVQLLLHLSVQNIMARDLVPRTLIDIFMFKYCVHYWQSPIRENHWGSNQEVHFSQMEYSQEPHPARQEGWILWTIILHISTNDSQDSFLGLKIQGNNLLGPLEKTPKVAASRRRDTRIPTLACHLLRRGSPGWNRVHPVSRRLPEPSPCIEASLIISSWYRPQALAKAPYPPERRRSMSQLPASIAGGDQSPKASNLDRRPAGGWWVYRRYSLFTNGKILEQLLAY